MAKQTVDATDVLNAGRVKINDNFTELYNGAVIISATGSANLGYATLDAAAINLIAESMYANCSLIVSSKGAFAATLLSPSTGSATVQSVGGAVNLLAATKVVADKPVIYPSYTVAQANALTPSSYTGGMIYVNNESGGAVMAFSDGINWRRMTDRIVIS